MTDQAELPTSVEEHLRRLAPNMLLYGLPGEGKTHALRTALDVHPTSKLFVIHTEAPGVGVLSDLDPDRYHYTFIPPAAESWDTMLTEAQEMLRLPWDVMKDKTHDPRKASYTGYLRILRACQNFTCDHCGQSFGDISKFPPHWTFAIDSLSGLNGHMMQGTIGDPYALSLPQYGTAMKKQLRFLDKLCFDTQGMFVLTAHAERLTHELTGSLIIRPLAIGNKNAPEIPKNFTDMIWAYRVGKKFYWSTERANTDLKAVNLPYGEDKLPPTLVAPWTAWARRNGIELP